MRPNVQALYHQFNNQYFYGHLPSDLPIILNSRLQTSAGRCIGKYDAKKDLKPIRIELHVRLFDDIGWDYCLDGWPRPESELTLLHEMTHAYMFMRYNDRYHSRRFQEIMNRITGVRTNHRCHNLDVDQWRRQRGVRKTSKPILIGFNPFLR